MPHLEIRKFIPASAESVWAVLADVERQGDWMVDVDTLEVVSEQKQGEGLVMNVRSRLFGMPLVRDVMEITRWDPPRRMDVLHRGQFHGTGSFILKPVHNGTVFTWIEDFDTRLGPLSPLGNAGFALAVRPHLMRVFARSMDNVRRLAIERELIGAPHPAPTTP